MKYITKTTCIGIIAVALCSMLLFSCGGTKKAPILKMATTTSTDNTGLLDYIAPSIEKECGFTLQWVAVGTGKALELGKNCDVDVLLVHAPSAEKKYVKDGHGTDRTELMYNDFVIIGPKEDPAGIKGKSVSEALKTVKAKKALFASRGDNSGTNKKEIKLWKTATKGTPDKEKWYVQTGQGMLNTINIAAERKGYTLTDRGTFIKYEANHKGNPPLIIVVEKDSTLKNQYAIMAVNKQKCAKVKYDLAKKCIDWFKGEKAQKLIGDFKLLNKQLFIPNAQ